MLYISQLSRIKSQVSTISHLVIPFILFESLFRSLSVLVIPFILRESLFRSLSVLVTPFILCESLLRSLSVKLIHASNTQVSKVSKVSSQSPSHSDEALQSQLPGHSHRSAITALRSWACGHVPKVMPYTHYTSLTTHIHTYHNVHPHIKQFSISRKCRNNKIKQLNGNGKKMINICYWNLGSKNWTKKRNQIQALADQFNPDILVISEANLNPETPLYESQIQGYQITFPKSTSINMTARIIMLTKDELNFKVEENLMVESVSSIWIKLSIPGSKPVLICGVYREHQYLGQVTDWSLQPEEQARRWNTFLRQVERASQSSICHLIGDFNLDFKRWNSPDQAHRTNGV